MFDGVFHGSHDAALCSLSGQVSDTLPLSNWLFQGTNPAHARLRPQDMRHNDAWQRMAKVKDASVPEKRKAYDEICKNISPVMHHFFLETYPSPAQWFDRRLAYSRSVAVNSMVGYVLGIGDRHSSNVLLKTKTGELVQIDLGVAFEQGLALPMPELIPFRLTRDIVDGFGVSGVEGVMRRCSEEMMRVLRRRKEYILTIVDVLVHDPITKWVLSAEAARRRQGGIGADGGAGGGGGDQQDGGAPSEQRSAEDGALASPAAGPDGADSRNADAEKVLMRVRQKLDGFEDGDIRSVEGQARYSLLGRPRGCIIMHCQGFPAGAPRCDYDMSPDVWRRRALSGSVVFVRRQLCASSVQVQHLIQQARDPDRLCQLFHGWAAWM